MKNRPNQVRAAILVEQNKPLIIDNIELPKDLLPGQVLVKVLVSGICGSQIGEICGAKGPDRYLPHLLGHEGCATVIGIGPGVKTLCKGDLVVLHWRKGVGIESETPNYIWRGKKVNAGWVTTFNKYAVVSENRCTSIPKEISKIVDLSFEDIIDHIEVQFKNIRNSISDFKSGIKISGGGSKIRNLDLLFKKHFADVPVDLMKVNNIIFKFCHRLFP